MLIFISLELIYVLFNLFRKCISSTFPLKGNPLYTNLAFCISFSWMFKFKASLQHLALYWSSFRFEWIDKRQAPKDKPWIFATLFFAIKLPSLHDLHSVKIIMSFPANLQDQSIQFAIDYWVLLWHINLATFLTTKNLT